MKIYIVSAQYIGSITGGGGIHVVDLSRELSKLGHGVIVISMGIGDNKKEETVTLSDPFNPDPTKRESKVKVFRFWTKDSHHISGPFEGSKLEEINRLEEFGRQVLQFLKKIKDKSVIHLHGHFMIPSIAKELRDKDNFRIITSIHTFESLSEARKGKDGAGAKFIEFMQEKERQAIKYSDYLVVRSHAVKDQITSLFPADVKNANIEIISSGVSSVFIHHPSLGGDKLDLLKQKYRIKGKFIFNLNRIDPSKGIEYGIEALPKLIKKLKKTEGKTSRGVSMVIAGMIEDKNQWYLERLEKIVKKLGVDKSVSFYTDISEEDKIGLFNLADVFLLSSIIEPFGITIVEALSKNVPVVTAGVEGPMDIMGVRKVEKPFIWGNGGLVVYYNNPLKRSEYISESLFAVFKNPEKVSKLIEKGKKKVLSIYAWESLVQKKLSIYRKALAIKRK
ncbi:MAG: glycosyltransferase family 4 protein [Spirochaetes bacterium]|nr:glycosyltransferase family 4 protein [Spirochaetota bacterium]